MRAVLLAAGLLDRGEAGDLERGSGDAAALALRPRLAGVFLAGVVVFLAAAFLAGVLEREGRAGALRLATGASAGAGAEAATGAAGSSSGAASTWNHM